MKLPYAETSRVVGRVRKIENLPIVRLRRERRKLARARTYTAREILREYKHGRRDFSNARLDGEVLAFADLRDAAFFGASMKHVNLAGAVLWNVRFDDADLTGSSLEGAFAAGANFMRTNLTDAFLYMADFMASQFHKTNFTNANMMFASLRFAKLSDVTLADARLTGVWLEATALTDMDIGPLCSARRLKHLSPSPVEFRTIVRSYTHPELQQFLIDCGVPPIFATYMLDCARSVSEPLMKKLMQSTFISYGGPDEQFARRIYEALRAHQVTTFFFPENALAGARIGMEVFRQLQRHDRVLLICSRSSLGRPGVVNEINETLEREARDGGATYLLPIALDDYVLKGWRKVQPDLATRVGSRVIANFRGARSNGKAFNKAMHRVIDALKIGDPMAVHA